MNETDATAVRKKKGKKAELPKGVRNDLLQKSVRIRAGGRVLFEGKWGDLAEGGARSRSRRGAAESTGND